MTAPLTLRVERTIPATPEELFAAWTTPDVLAQWWAPPGGRCVSATIDLRLGGTYTIVNELPGGAIVTIRGEYLAIEPSRLLSFTWATGESQPATETVTITFEADGQDTVVAVVHTRLPSEEVADGHKAGWNACLDSLARSLHTVHE
ncbi:MAG: SRPBCC domain-containing protein [Actinomycetota bacterium]